MIGLRWARDAGEMNLEDLPRLHLFNPIGHFFAEIELVWLKGQGFVLACTDFNRFGDWLCGLSAQVYVSG